MFEGLFKKNPGKSDLITYALMAGGAYLVYWYINNYGPNGAVSAGGVSYWNTWFGASTTATSNITQPQPVTIAQNSSGTGASSGTTGGTGTGQSSVQVMATQDQLNAINAFLSASDQRVLASMPPLTYQQAQTMLANAQACQAGQGFNPAANACYAPKTQTQTGGTGPGSTRGSGVSNTSGTPGGGGADTTANQLVLLAGGGSPMLSADQWNYYYSRLSGVTQTADLFPAGQPRTTPISVQQYLQARVADGLEIMLNGNANVASSGLASSGRTGSSGVRGMGQIMPLSPFVTPAWNGVRDPNFLTNGAGLGAIVPLAPSITPASSGLGNLSQAVKSPWGKLPVNPMIQ